MINCCLTASDLFPAIYIVGGTNYVSIQTMMSALICTRPIQQSYILTVLTRWNNNARTHMSLYWTHYSDSWKPNENTKQTNKQKRLFKGEGNLRSLCRVIKTTRHIKKVITTFSG
jgi:hypothetical protein